MKGERHYPHPSRDEMLKDIDEWLAEHFCPMIDSCRGVGIPHCDPNSDGDSECVLNRYQSGEELRNKELYRLWLPIFIYRMKGC